MKHNLPKKSHGLRLPTTSLQTWMSALRTFGKPVRGVVASELTDTEFMKMMVRKEKANIASLWEAFTTNRESMGRYLSDPKKQGVAYLLGFHLPNLARLYGVLERLGSRQLAMLGGTRPQSIRVIDIGTGTGAMSQGVAEYLNQHKIRPESLHWDLIDNRRAFLDIAEHVVQTAQPRAQIRTLQWDLKSGVRLQAEPGETVIVLLGYVWNELVRLPKIQQQLIKQLQQLAAEHPTAVVFLEPANQQPARSAMELRNVLTEAMLQPIYPCPKALACPMLLRTRDWCYSEFEWDVPPATARIDQALELDHHRISVAGYIFVNEALTAKNAKAELPPVIVGRPRRTNGDGFDYLVCLGTALEKRRNPKARYQLRGDFLAAPTKTSSSPASPS